ncbi:hypothetical protein [Campylobacter geochelonis]|uniref:Uncharacterized protein n=1 Tax=Campylobacter geochelonis TaxID=1780362 RepID=A0A128EH33_9BACT|nr:hypothetical protein [Campylobacter geochelonis]QKF71920.1 hypothetical protein CGEO_1646 [Campylobacter geochelonis]CZE47871.1 Uncharacterised protein [Campylobacter geochelonis]
MQNLTYRASGLINLLNKFANLENEAIKLESEARKIRQKMQKIDEEITLKFSQKITEIQPKNSQNDESY